MGSLTVITIRATMGGTYAIVSSIGGTITIITVIITITITTITTIITVTGTDDSSWSPWQSHAPYKVERARCAGLLF